MKVPVVVVCAKKISKKAEIALKNKAKMAPVIAAKKSPKKTTVVAVKGKDKKISAVLPVKGGKINKRLEAVIKSDPKDGVHENLMRSKVSAL